MPTYTYHCEVHGDFDVRNVKVAEREDNKDCPICGKSSEYNPSFQTSPPQFNGTGFYQTDYKGKT